MSHYMDEELRAITECLPSSTVIGTKGTMRTIWHCLEHHDDGPVWFMVRELEDFRWCTIATGTPLEMIEAGNEVEIVYDVHRYMEGKIALWPEIDSNLVTLHKLIDGSMSFADSASDELCDEEITNYTKAAQDWRRKLAERFERAE